VPPFRKSQDNSTKLNQLMKKNLPSTDLKGARYKTVICFFQDSAQRETRKHDFYSKFMDLTIGNKEVTGI
jgi:hypothetical protein